MKINKRIVSVIVVVVVALAAVLMCVLMFGGFGQPKDLAEQKRTKMDDSMRNTLSTDKVGISLKVAMTYEAKQAKYDFDMEAKFDRKVGMYMEANKPSSVGSDMKYNAVTKWALPAGGTLAANIAEISLETGGKAYSTKDLSDFDPGVWFEFDPSASRVFYSFDPCFIKATTTFLTSAKDRNILMDTLFNEKHINITNLSNATGIQSFDFTVKKDSVQTVIKDLSKSSVFAELKDCGLDSVVEKMNQNTKFSVRLDAANNKLLSISAKDDKTFTMDLTFTKLEGSVTLPAKKSVIPKSEMSNPTGLIANNQKAILEILTKAPGTAGTAAQ